MNLTPHPDTWLAADQIGSRYYPYQPTYEHKALSTDATYLWLATRPRLRDNQANLGILGWLTRDDALKLYELAWFATGNILELGTFHGLSTFIMAQAVARRRATTLRGLWVWLTRRLVRRVPRLHLPVIATVELDPINTTFAYSNLYLRDLAHWVAFHSGEAGSFCEGLIEQGKQYSFVFVDHSHAYADVMLTCRQLSALVEPGGFVLFHDYNNTLNLDVTNADYGVSRAVFDALDMHLFEFYGIYGCTGLFRKKVHSA